MANASQDEREATFKFRSKRFTTVLVFGTFHLQSTKMLKTKKPKMEELVDKLRFV